jgi:putative ABC transport system permease protein
MVRHFPLILKNCWRNRRRTVLTVLSISVSMCLLGVMISMYHAFYLSSPAPEEALRLVVRNRISLTVDLPLFYGARIRQIPGVREVMVSQWFNGTYKDSRDPKNFFGRLSSEPDKLFRMFPEFVIPEDQKQAFLKDRTGCVVGRDLANSLGFRVGDRVPLTGDIFPGEYEFTVRGIFDSPRPSGYLFFDNEYLTQSLPEARRGRVGAFYILLDSAESAGRVTDAVDGMFRNSTAETKTESEQAFNLSFLALLGNVKMLLLGVAGAVTFTILLVSANSMAMSARERTWEVGVMKTLGFTPRIILGLIVGEACLISVAGGALGYLIAGGLITGIRRSPYGGMLPAIDAFAPSVALTCILAAAAIGAISSLAPALAASRTSIVNALRSSD